jgi:transcriptional regulator with XRE-family HTH domain
MITYDAHVPDPDIDAVDDESAGTGAAQKPDAETRRVGARLRQLRQSHSMSARDVAARAGVSPGYLSRLENGHISPTVATLSRVVQAMGESVAKLFAADDSPGLLVRQEDRRLVRHHGVDDFRLTPGWAERLEVLETVIQAKKGSGPTAYSHAGDEECVVLVEGKLTVWVDDSEYALQPGDAITFSSRSPHRWLNPSTKPARALWVITPASY